MNFFVYTALEPCKLFPQAKFLEKQLLQQGDIYCYIVLKRKWHWYLLFMREKKKTTTKNDNFGIRKNQVHILNQPLCTSSYLYQISPSSFVKSISNTYSKVFINLVRLSSNIIFGTKHLLCDSLSKATSLGKQKWYFFILILMTVSGFWCVCT